MKRVNSFVVSCLRKQTLSISSQCSKMFDKWYTATVEVDRLRESMLTFLAMFCLISRWLCVKKPQCYEGIDNNKVTELVKLGSRISGKSGNGPHELLTNFKFCQTDVFNILDWHFLKYLIVSCNFNIIDIKDRGSYVHESNIVNNDSFNDTMV